MRGHARGAGLIQLRPRSNTRYINQNRTLLATALDGFIDDQSHVGLFVDDTRLVSKYRWRVAGRELNPVALSTVEQHTWLGYYIAPPVNTSAPGTVEGKPPQQVVEVRLSRAVGDGFHEDVDLRNYTQQRVAFDLELEVDADFRGMQEQGSERKQHGTRRTHFRQVGPDAWELSFDYHAENEFDHQGHTGTATIDRSVTLRFEGPPSPPAYHDGRVFFQIALEPQGTWHACVKVIGHIDGETLAPQYPCRAFVGAHTDRDVKRGTFHHYATSFSAPASDTLTHVVVETLEQAKRDLVALRLYDLDEGERSWTMAAGLPLFVALFGRDTLTTAWQASLATPDMLTGTLRALSHSQGSTVDDWRNEQPGKILHQARRGPTSALCMSPWGRHYGSTTSSALFPVAVAELWHWTGDRALVEPLVDRALAAIHWLDTYGDADRDGIYEYNIRSEDPQKNQAWKDSDEAIVYDDGSQVHAPIGTCEEQGFAYVAKLHLSEVLFWLGRTDEARRLYEQATELKKRFNDAFWMPREKFFALGLDADKRQIRSITSNPGHCLATGIVDDALVEPTVNRLFARDMFSGWGIRTLSSDHPAYNPYAYQRGNIWPVEHGTFALGLVRYGRREHAEMLCRAQFEAAALFDHYRLPEAFGGEPRDAEHPFPSIYPNANSPQAWSSSATFWLLQAMLGLYPYAPLNLLMIDPVLPNWLPEITVANLHVGRAVVAIRFFRTAKGATDYEILDQRGPLHVVKQPSPWSLTAGPPKRVRDALTSLIK